MTELWSELRSWEKEGISYIPLSSSPNRPRFPDPGCHSGPEQVCGHAARAHWPDNAHSTPRGTDLAGTFRPSGRCSSEGAHGGHFA